MGVACFITACVSRQVEIKRGDTINQNSLMYLFSLSISSLSLLLAKGLHFRRNQTGVQCAAQHFKYENRETQHILCQNAERKGSLGLLWVYV